MNENEKDGGEIVQKAPHYQNIPFYGGATYSISIDIPHFIYPFTG